MDVYLLVVKVTGQALSRLDRVVAEARLERAQGPVALRANPAAELGVASAGDDLLAAVVHERAT